MRTLCRFYAVSEVPTGPIHKTNFDTIRSPPRSILHPTAAIPPCAHDLWRLWPRRFAGHQWSQTSGTSTWREPPRWWAVHISTKPSQCVRVVRTLQYIRLVDLGARAQGRRRHRQVGERTGRAASAAQRE